MKKIAVALLMVGSLSVAGQASAHGNNGGDVVGALIGGAVLGAVVTSALNPAPVVAYQQPVYAQPVYAQPVYQPAPVYAGPPPGRLLRPIPARVRGVRRSAVCAVWVSAAAADVVAVR